MKQVKTVELGGKIKYAKVADRLCEFRSDNPRSKIWTDYQRTEDGDYIFNAFIWRDKTELVDILAKGVGREEAKFSCDANGTASANAQKVEREKGFEKLETIAVGRALAMLGYAADGNVASYEEMLEFEEFKQEQALQAVQNALEELGASKTVEELKQKFMALERSLRANDEVVAKKDEMKAKLTELEDEGAEDRAE